MHDVRSIERPARGSCALAGLDRKTARDDDEQDAGVPSKAVKSCQSATVTRFIAWCDERGIASIHDVTRPVLVRYQRWLFYFRKPSGKAMSFAAQHSALGAVRGFFRWLTREGHIHANPASELELPKVGMKLPKHVLTVDEVEAVMRVVDLDSEQGVRDRAILEGQNPQCWNTRVKGVGRGGTQDGACKAAKKDADRSVPQGCYKRHCQCTCSKR